jgi:hypothetical protein
MLRASVGVRNPSQASALLWRTYSASRVHHRTNARGSSKSAKLAARTPQRIGNKVAPPLRFARITQSRTVGTEAAKGKIKLLSMVEREANGFKLDGARMPKRKFWF